MLQLQINAGHLLLDEDYGEDWVFNIDIDTLNMQSCDKDILGQLYGGYELGLSTFELQNGNNHGFTSKDSRLQDLQLQTIKRLRKERSRMSV
jgi:hypothetical protein